MLSFGFYQESYYASFFLFTYLWSITVDVPIRIFMRKHSKYLEWDADMYAVERGYGKVLQDALMRSHCVSLDTLFPSWVDDLWNSCHPNLHERLQYIQEKVDSYPELAHIDDINAVNLQVPDPEAEDKEGKEKDEAGNADQRNNATEPDAEALKSVEMTAIQSASQPLLMSDDPNQYGNEKI